MSIAVEKELPFDMKDDLAERTEYDPGYFDKIMIPELMYKDFSPSEIKISIQNCFACEHNKFNKPIELGNFHASTMIIGEKPSDIDFKTDEGKVLASLLQWAGFHLDDVYLTSLIKCQDTKTPSKCFNHLLSELLCLQPKVILCLGDNVSKYFHPVFDQPGYKYSALNRYDMIVTYGSKLYMQEQTVYEQFCNHVLGAKHILDSKL